MAPCMQKIAFIRGAIALDLVVAKAGTMPYRDFYILQEREMVFWLENRYESMIN